MKFALNKNLWAWLWLILACQAFGSEAELSSPSTVIPETPNVIPDVDAISDDEMDMPASPVVANNKLRSRTLKLEIANNGNTTKIMIICSPVSASPSSLDAVHDSDIPVPETSGPTSASTVDSSAASSIPDSDYSENLSSPVQSSSLLNKVDLVALDFDGNHEVSVESQYCDHITIDGGVPDWVERLSIKNDEGSIALPSGWAKEAHSLKNLWLRISKGLTINRTGWDYESHQGEEGETTGRILNLCSVLPPSLELLDASHTLLETLKLDGICSSKLIRLEASHSSLHTIALCTPSLVTLHLSGNSLNGSLNWMTCGGGLAAVEYLQANHNSLTEVDTCGWFSLRTLDLRHNAITSLDITNCRSSNLTSVTAPHNHLVTPPLLPDSLLHLDLNHNELESLPTITSTLMTADFSHNNIIEIGKARFKRARKLLHLSLAHNHITHVKEHDLSGLRELRTLDLSHNRLREVAGTSLMNLRHLKKLYLHHNHLNSLDSRDLAALIPRAHATLHHNPWYCVCKLLASLQRLQHCPDCQPQAVAVECRERGSRISAGPFLQTCLHAVQEVTQRLNLESDEDLSEEQNDDGPGGGDGNQNAVVAVPALLILIAVGAVVAASYRLYHRHKRTISTRWNVFRNRFGLCRMCGCSPMSLNNGDLNSHQHGGLSQIEQDSDTETEL